VVAPHPGASSASPARSATSTLLAIVAESRLREFEERFTLGPVEVAGPLT
jgi:hypothetical protein